MNDAFADLITGAELIASITDPDQMAEVEQGLQSIIGKLEARLSSITDQPIQRAVAEPVEEAPEPRKPRRLVTGRMTRAEIVSLFNAR